MKTKLVLVVGAALLASTVALVTPAGAGDGVWLTVVKEVEGTPPADAEFVIEVICVRIDLDDAGLEPLGVVLDYGGTFTFGPDGGEESLEILGRSECTITETDDGGADEVIGGEQTVVFEDPLSQEVIVTNVFEPEAVTTAAPTTSTTSTSTTAAAAAVTAAPRFTG